MGSRWVVLVMAGLLGGAAAMAGDTFPAPYCVTSDTCVKSASSCNNGDALVVFRHTIRCVAYNGTIAEVSQVQTQGIDHDPWDNSSCAADIRTYREAYGNCQ